MPPNLYKTFYAKISSLGRAAFREDALQCPAMHRQAPHRFRDVAVTQPVNALDMFPPYSIGRHWIVRWWGTRPRPRQKGVHHVVGIGRFGKIVGRTDFHRRHCRGDGTISGQDHDAAFRASLTQGVYNIKATSILKPKVDNLISGRSTQGDGTAS